MQAFFFFFQSLFSLGKFLTLCGRQTRARIMAEIPIGMGAEIPGVMVEEKFDKAGNPFFSPYGVVSPTCALM